MQGFNCLNIKRFKRSLLFLVPILLSASTLLNQPTLEKILAKDVDCPFSVNWYDIYGADVSELKENLLAFGPVDEKGIHRYALVSWNLSWKWQVLENGRPDLSTSEVTSKIRLTLPRWIDKVRAPKELQYQWDSMLSKIGEHERNHLKNACSAFKQTQSLLSEASKQSNPFTATELNHEIKQVVAKHRIKDVDYDQNTSNGKTEGIKL